MPKTAPPIQVGVMKNQWMTRPGGLSQVMKPNYAFSRQGLVFYADLWHPDQQAIGSLINGTGVAAEAPATLAIGNNTINVTTQGTFVVYVRGSGTATSGTATVSGSPVTLVSGHNTITVTGTGTITIALNNVITDKSGNGHLMTITGTTWGNTGRIFDGDDLINAGNNSILNILGDFSAIVWLKTTDPGAGTNYHILVRGLVSTDGYTIRVTNGNKIQYITSQAAADQVTRSTALPSDTWVQYAVSRSGTSATCYLNAVSAVDSAGSHTNPTTNTRNFKVGVADNSAQYLIGTIGEIWIFNEALTLAEIEHNCLATKWRYQ